MPDLRIEQSSRRTRPGRRAWMGVLFALVSCETATYSLEIRASGNGSTSPATGVAAWAPGTSVKVTAIPSLGSAFLGWSGAASGAQNPVSVVMDGNKALVAQFASVAVVHHWLKLEVNGEGTTDPGAGSHLYGYGEAVEVTATPAAGATFTGWSGAATGAANPVAVTMDGNKTLTANFSTGAAGHTLQINVSGDGMTNPPAGTLSYAAGSQIEVTARPAAGATFTGWSGTATGTASPTTVTMDGNKTLTASFTTAAVHYDLGISVTGNGSTSPSAGTHSYAAGTQVQVAATPASGAVFAGWSGAATGTVNPTTVTMDGDKNLAASFSTAASHTLAIHVPESGTTSPAAGTYSYAPGTQVPLTAAPASGATFTGWSGAATGAANPTTVTMDANKTVTATFSTGGNCAGPVAGSSLANPITSEVFTADPAAMVDNCTFYIACGHDEAGLGQNWFQMREWFLMSSTDLVHWTRKVAMSLSTFKWADANAWAGQMIRAKNGKYYWHVTVQEASTGAMAIGVATADSPGGPWTDALGKPLINDAFEMANMGFATPSDTVYTIDPTVFVDDDGQAYLQYGGLSRLVNAKLNSDMISISGRMQESTPAGYFESPYLIKRNGKYYEIYAAGSNPATIDYATSNSPMGPWSRGGRVLDALPRSSSDTDWPTSHGGVAQLAGQWYIVYHISDGPKGGGTYRREVAIDKLTFNSDGSIQKVVPSKVVTF
jgi:uncharacterized repeat protein (TIGR02543 family)